MYGAWGLIWGRRVEFSFIISSGTFAICKEMHIEVENVSCV